MDPISQQADSLIREGDPSNPRPDNDVKPSSADAVANPDAPSKPKDASKPRDTKRKSAKKQAKGSKAKKDKKKKKKKRAAINDSSDSSSTSSDDDSTELDSDSDSADDEVVVRRRRTNKKREEAPKLKTVGNTKKHKGHVKSKLKPTAGSDLDSDSSHTGWASSSDDVEESEPILDPPKKTKDHDLKQDVGFQVARELQRLLQLAQTHAPPPPGLSSHAALGSAFDSGLGPGLLPNSGNAFPRSAAIGGLPATYSSMAGGRARPAYDDRLALLDGLGDPLGRDGGLSNRRARHGGLGADKKLPGSAADPQKQKSKKYDFKRVDQVWDNSIHNFKLQDTAESAADKKYDGFCFHVRRTFDWEGKYKATVVDVKSKALRECLQDVIGNIKGVSLVDETPKLDPNVLFLYLEDLRKHAKHLRKQVKSPTATDKQERKKEAKWLEEKRLHLKVLVKYIDKDYEHVKKSLYPMLEHGLITFDLLWALWKPGTLAYTTTYGSHDEPRVFKVDTAEKHYHISKGEFYYVDGKYFEYDGKQFGYGRMMEEIGEFRGAKRITSLGSYPLKYHKNEEQIRKDLIERGKKFASLSGVHYKSHHGMAYYKKKKSIIKVNVNGRVMIDPSIHRRINPNYPISLVRPKEQDVLTEDEESDEDACCAVGSDSEDDGAQDGDLEEGEEKVKYVTKVIKDNKGRLSIVRMTKDEAEEMNKEKLSKVETQDDTIIDGSSDEGKSQSAKKNPEWTDEEYLIASPVVLGFSFGEKLWLEFTVSGVQEIRWNEHAYESLVLEKRTKETVKALVESHKYHAAESIDDVIQGKGKGLVSVLHGPPGTGKTLTAEGISELLKCPLYMVSAGELGTDSRVLEGELQRILDICHAWGAILLLDEADVFLEKRNMHDIHRNALVSIFLRQLEYFQGILFLTTNRVETFDDAFQSRIHIALRYDPLDLKAKKAIFKMFVEKARLQQKNDSAPFTEEEYNTLARHDLNGRQIKNTVIRAQALAVNKGEPLSMAHVRQILDVQVNFDRDLKGGTGYQDAMRSYF
ncbi:putative aaa family atpase [Diaporthe ampelina]|uniref:Putative aaa family atpase n=1 Tax=Diaporthe ampelina TaxID=1214573 RepID=A0A0G2HTU4_9PEZI|nr:putative aaa family atpase [Diaporthe ampelina]